MPFTGEDIRVIVLGLMGESLGGSFGSVDEEIRTAVLGSWGRMSGWQFWGWRLRILLGEDILVAVFRVGEC